VDDPVAEVWRIERRTRTSNRQARPNSTPEASMNAMTKSERAGAINRRASD